MKDAARIEAVIFDCDGTLVDSERLSAQLLVEMLAEQGIHCELEGIFRMFRGVKFQQFLAQLGGLYPQLDIDAFGPEFRARSLPVYRERLQEMPGAVALVRQLHLKKCIASNGPREKIETCLGAVGLLDEFEGRIVSAYEVGFWKPDPHMILRAAELLGVEPARCLLIDDTLEGVGAGIAAGVQVIGYGDTDFSSLAGTANFRSIEHMSEIGRLLLPA